MPQSPEPMPAATESTPPASPEDVIVDLWAAVFGEPPPVRAALSVMVGALVSGLPEPDRLVAPHACSTSAATEA